MAKKSSILPTFTSLCQWLASDSIGSIITVIIVLISSLLLLMHLLTPSIPNSKIIYGQEDELVSSNLIHANQEAYGSVWKSVHEQTRHARHVYVVPGGGSSISNNKDTLDNNNDAYPLWTKQRVQAAYHHYSTVNPSDSIFLALSAGSLNAPNQRSLSSGNVIFECQHIIRHLVDLGVKEELIHGDFISWDTVGNGLTLRLFLEGLLSARAAERINQQAEASVHESYIEEIYVEVFISDFHSERVKSTFEWVLDLSPSLISGASHPVHLRMHSVSSQGVKWKSKEDFVARIEHEKRGVLIIEENKAQVKTLAELYAFLLLGPHRGIRSYLLESYQPSKGGGW